MSTQPVIKSNDLDAINAAVAERVAGWKRVATLEMSAIDTNGIVFGRRAIPSAVEAFQLGEIIVEHPPRFTDSADAVLPLLEKWRDRPYLYRMAQIDVTGEGWEVKIAQPDMDGKAPQWFWRVSHVSLPTAICIALLRAHGVTVED